MTPMETRILLGTESGLWRLRGDALEPVDPFVARTVTALARSGDETWAVVDGRALWHNTGREWTERASLGDRPATALASTPQGLLIGTAQAHLLRWVGDTLEPPASPGRTIIGLSVTGVNMFFFLPRRVVSRTSGEEFHSLKATAVR